MEKLTIIKTSEDLAPLLKAIESAEYVAYDTETTGLDEEALIIGFSVSFDETEGHYVILRGWNPATSTLEAYPTLAGAPAIIEALAAKKLIMHNGVFDCRVTKKNFGIDLMPSLHTDTHVLAHLLDENRHNGLKELGIQIFGEDANKEQKEMKESVTKNGGVLTKDKYELYKADADLLARYGAKDAILTYKLFWFLVPQVFEQGLDTFFYDEECMPLLRGPTYQLNTTGLKVDAERLEKLKAELNAEILDSVAFIYKEITPLIAPEYTGKTKKETFNIGSNHQLSWLLFEKLQQSFVSLTDQGKELCKALYLRAPYSNKDKRDFIDAVKAAKGNTWAPETFNRKTGKMSKAKKVGDYWTYLTCGKATLAMYAKKYTWVDRTLKLNKAKKLLSTYVLGIEERVKYGIIRPDFKQTGTTSGRYSCKNPNFQNLPRDDKRVKACIVSRPGKVFVGADYSQLEPRVFASLSGDESLIKSFASTEDFYSVIGMTSFGISDALPQKDGHPDAFGIKYKKLRDISKVVALSATYGTTAPKMAPAIGKTIDEAQEIIDLYFESFPKVKQFMTDCHEKAMENGQVVSLYGRPRRMPAAKDFKKIYGGVIDHAKMMYEHRNVLNLAVNHTVQSSGASIVNRAAIRFVDLAKKAGLSAKLVMNVHDELVAECDEAEAETTKKLLQLAMETAAELPGVRLEAEPKIANDLAKLK